MELIASESDRPSLGISFWTFRTQGREKNPGWAKAEQIAGIAQPIVLSLEWRRKSEYLYLNFQLDAIASGEHGLKLFLGDQAYIGIKSKNLLWGLGRKSDPVSFPAWNSWKDGVEGFFVETNSSPTQVRFDLLDLYRGFPLLENGWLSFYGRENYLTPSAAKELLPESPDRMNTSSRFRSGIHIYGTKDSSWVYQGRLRYLSLGNWGSFGKETKESKAGSEIGDNDYLTEWRFSLGYLWKHFYLSGDLYLTRGLEKTGSNRFRSEKSLGINGQALRIDLGAYSSFGKISLFGFLPNREKRNSQGEILELGFVGMGTSPLANPLLVQVWEFYPSSWVTPRGLEREDSNYPTKRPAGFCGIRLEGNLSSLQFEVRYTYISFLETEKEFSGRWVLTKEAMSSTFLREAGIRLRYSPIEELPAYLEIHLGGIETEVATGIKQWYLLLKAGATW